MKQILLYILLSLIAMPMARAAEMPESPEAPFEAPLLEEITISIKGKELRVQNAEGLVIDVYNVAGMKVASHRVDSPDKTVQLSVERGIYIVKVGKVARRINVL